ncbi:hypothetical protein ABXN37_08420 [Piscinibacter sakaiensis]|uniref:hypothetical protein n=1 Tax=Piscinibacter sakaiensis TaxID=1547922 RepID=UPI00372B67F2
MTELAGGRRREGWQPAEAEGLVRAVFAGLLGREPDEEALRAYSEFLVGSQNPAGLVGDVAGSAEHLQQVVAQQAPALVQLVFRALLEREADPEALAAYSARLTETRDLQALVAEVGASREHRNLLLRRLAAGAAA